MRELIERIETIRDKNQLYVIRVSKTNKYVVGDDIYDVKIGDIKNAKRFKKAELPDELGEEPYPAELDTRNLEYKNMSGAIEYYVEKDKR